MSTPYDPSDSGRPPERGEGDPPADSPPQYGQPPAPYGQQPPQPPHGQQPPAYGEQPPQPTQGQQPSPYGQPPNPYGQQPQYGEPPPYGQQLPQYGQQPPPYGQQLPQYGEPPSPYGRQPSPYGPPPDGQSPYGYGQAPGGYQTPRYAGWGNRVASYLLDTVVTLPPYLIGLFLFGSTQRFEGNGAASASGGLFLLLGGLATLGLTIWNRWIRAGRTGQSLGKMWMGSHLVDEQTGQPIGALNAFVRDLLHLLDGICYIGYILAAFDAKTQTFADKIKHTIVVEG